ncbi:MAG: PfkB family carbohydrate kinase [Patescibacteria group bacterium]
MSKHKIKNIQELVKIVGDLKKEGKKIVLAHGAFDWLHHGLLHYLNEAKKQGDILIVSVIADKFVRKGLAETVFKESIRAGTIAFFEPVDYVILCHDFGPWGIIKQLRPDIYVKGEDSASQLKDPLSGVSRDKKAAENAGGKLIFTKILPIHSESALNRYFNIAPDSAAAFISDFKKRYNVSDVLINLEKLKKMKVLVIGETIIDEYRYVSPLGKPAKSHVVAAHYKNKEEFVGGAAACANHVATVCGDVELVTVLGSKNSKDAMVKKCLKPNVKASIFYSLEQKTIVKRRFLDEGSFVKFFEEYEFVKGPISENVKDKVKKYLSQKIGKFDLVVVVDYGHGFLLPDMIKLIGRKSKFLAVTAQTNSGNAGFNYITKYGNADYVSLDESEARLAMQDDYSPIENILLKLFKQISPRQLVITLGKRGLIACGKNEEIKRIPAFAGKITDAVGAGDAFLCLSAPCAAAGFKLDLVSFVGNIAAAIAVNIVGNKSSVEREELFKYIGYLLE